MPLSYLLILLATVIAAAGLTVAIGYGAGLIPIGLGLIALLALRTWLARR